MQPPSSPTTTLLDRWQPPAETCPIPTACFRFEARLLCFNRQNRAITSRRFAVLLSTGEPYSVVLPFLSEDESCRPSSRTNRGGLRYGPFFRSGKSRTRFPSSAWAASFCTPTAHGSRKSAPRLAGPGTDFRSHCQRGLEPRVGIDPVAGTVDHSLTVQRPQSR
jgi:hypothetical protein